MTNPTYVWKVSGIIALPANIQALIRAAFEPGHEVRAGLDGMDSAIPEITTESGFDLHTGEAWRCFKGILLRNPMGVLVLIGARRTCPPDKNNPCPPAGPAPAARPAPSARPAQSSATPAPVGEQTA